jgi:hypothetical protein
VAAVAEQVIRVIYWVEQAVAVAVVASFTDLHLYRELLILSMSVVVVVEITTETGAMVGILPLMESLLMAAVVVDTYTLMV